MADWEIIGLRWVLYLSLALVTGLPIFARLSRSDDLPNASVPQAWIVLVLALCAMCLSVLGFAMQVATMTGSTLFDVDATIVSSLLDQTSLGLALKVRLFAILAAAILAAAALARHSAGWFLQAMAGAVALGTLAWSGHGAATDGPGGWVHLVADIIHPIAAAAWIGALLGFLSMLNAVRRRQDSAASATYRALANFAATGSVLVSVLILTGLTNGWYILKEGSLRDALFAPYAQLLILAYSFRCHAGIGIAQ
jgi:putative copper resistance protein D